MASNLNHAGVTIHQRYAVDASDLTRLPKGTDAPVWWGIIGLILIELSVVFAFVVSGLYLQMINEQWPPPGITPPDVFLPSVSVAVLLVSCITMRLASNAINKDQINRFVIYTFTSVALACAVLVMRWLQMDALEVRWDQHAYGSLVWTISGFHFLHVVSAAIGTAVVGLLGVLGFFNSKQQIAIVVDTLYWNFVALAWLPFYWVVYWAPRWF